MFFRKNVIKKYRKKLKNIKQKYFAILQNERNKIISILKHDIKTPILAQNQSLKLLLNGSFGKISKIQKEILDEVYQSNKFLLEIVINSIFLEKYENEKPKLNLEKINFVEQIKDCCELIKPQANEKQQNIIIKKNSNDEIKLNADRKLVEKIIFNILSSSVNYGFENSNIEISVDEKPDSISFCAKNSSIYMTKEKLNSLFEDKEKSDFNQLGMNLNLNIAKKLIVAHNWDIIANSREDNSSSFGFVVKK